MSESNQWKSCRDNPPPEGQLVRTLSPGGLEQNLKREGGMYFGKDGCYVYYDPQYWQPLDMLAERERSHQ